MKKKAALFILGIFVALLSAGQNHEDALRYSMIDFNGTARFNGMAGAFGALGADISTLSTNPAGIGLFRKSEVVFTPGYGYADTQTMYSGNRATDERHHLNISNMGFVGTRALHKNTRWSSTHFGVAYNRTNSFQSNWAIQGENIPTSLLDVFVENANGTQPGFLYLDFPFTADLAYQTFLIDPLDTIANTYSSQIPQGEVRQTKSIERRGSMGETVLSFGANYDHRLYLGASVGFSNARFSEESKYTEVVMDTSLALDQYNYDYNLATNGSGVNLKLGAIYRINDWVRIGGAYHSPTFFNLSDQWSASMDSRFRDGDTYNFSSPVGSFDYNLTTPSRWIGSLGIVVKKSGVISIDHEWVNYAGARLNRSQLDISNYDFRAENSDIRTLYGPAQNLRIGTEWRLSPFRIRGGIAILGSPYRPSLNLEDAQRVVYSLGAGLRYADYFVDLSYNLVQWSEDYYLYDHNEIEKTTVERSDNRITATVGFRF